MVKKANDMGPQPNADLPISARKIMFSSLDFYLHLSCHLSHKDFRRPLCLVLLFLLVLLQEFCLLAPLLLGNTLPRQDSPTLVSLGKGLDLVHPQECLHRPPVSMVSTGDENEGLEAFGGIALFSVWERHLLNEIPSM